MNTTDDAQATPIDVSLLKDIRQDDIIIAFMGPSGSGKTFLVDVLAGPTSTRSQQRQTSSKKTGIRATRIKHPDYGDRILLLDTPGFDPIVADGLGPLQAVQKLKEWLEKHYDEHVRLTGLVYLQQITNTHEPYQHEALFKDLCGDTILSRIILVTTMWNEIQREEGERREQDLIPSWGSLTNSESTTHRFGDGTTGIDDYDQLRKEALKDFIIPLIIKHNDRESILLQEDFASLRDELWKSPEGRKLWSTLEEFLQTRAQVDEKLSLALGNDRAQELLQHLQKELGGKTLRKRDKLARLLKRISPWRRSKLKWYKDVVDVRLEALYGRSEQNSEYSA